MSALSDVVHSDLAACRHTDLDFTLDGNQYKYSKQVAVCNGCPVRRECLDEAMYLERGMPQAYRSTIRGGLSAPQRTRLARTVQNCVECGDRAGSFDLCVECSTRVSEERLTITGIRERNFQPRRGYNFKSKRRRV